MQFHLRYWKSFSSREGVGGLKLLLHGAWQKKRVFLLPRPAATLLMAAWLLVVFSGVGGKQSPRVQWAEVQVALCTGVGRNWYLQSSRDELQSTRPLATMYPGMLWLFEAGRGVISKYFGFPAFQKRTHLPCALTLKVFSGRT